MIEAGGKADGRDEQADDHERQRKPRGERHGAEAMFAERGRRPRSAPAAARRARTSTIGRRSARVRCCSFAVTARQIDLLSSASIEPGLVSPVERPTSLLALEHDQRALPLHIEFAQQVLLRSRSRW